VAALVEAKDPWRQAVTLSEETWEKHIVCEHPEMGAMASRDEILSCISQTISNPLYICQDAIHSNRRNFYLPFILPKPYQRSYLKVVVEYRKRWFGLKGYVRTAYSTTALKPGEKIIWQRKHQ